MVIQFSSVQFHQSVSVHAQCIVRKLNFLRAQDNTKRIPQQESRKMERSKY